MQVSGLAAVDIALAAIALSLLVSIFRLIVGPTDADRAVALDFGFVAFVAGAALLALRLEMPALLDLVLAATLVGFLATVAIARLVESRSS